MAETNRLILSIIYDAGELLLRVAPMLIAAVFLAEFARIRFGEEKLKALLAGRHHLTARLRAAALGAFLPFCECGAFPVMLGLVRTGVPTGAVLTFFLVSPVVSMPAFMILIGIFGLPFALYYLLITTTAAIVGGALLETAGRGRGIFKSGLAFDHHDENNLLACGCGAGLTDQGKGSPCQNQPSAQTCCRSIEDKRADLEENPEFAAIAGKAWMQTVQLLRKMAPYMAAVIAASALLRNLVDPEYIAGVLKAGAPFDILLGALVGIPIYTGDCAMIALAAPLIGATGALGAGIAFIISGSGTSISGIIFMSSVFKRYFVMLYIFTVFCIALIAGYLVSLLPTLGLA